MGDCIFCKIAAGEIGKLVHQDNEIAAFRDINPCGPVHILIVPRHHIPGLGEGLDDPSLMGRMAELAVKLAVEEGISKSGYRLVVNSGPDGGQSVPHLHMHLLGGRPFGWPPG